MSRCMYTNDIPDPVTGDPYYTCPRTRIKDGEYCPFHDKEYYKSHRDEVIAQFEADLDPDSGMQFIGCHFPSFDVQIDRHLACFNSAEFHGKAVFNKVRCDTFDLTDAKFHDDVHIQDMVAANLLLYNLRYDDVIQGKDPDPKTPATRKFEITKCVIDKLDVSSRKIRHHLAISGSDITICKFYNSILHAGLSATRCVFLEDVVIEDSKFMGDSKFNHCRFKEGLDLDRTSFEGPTSFDHVIFNSPKSVTFEGNLSNVSFAGTDISRVDFGVDVIWGGKDGHTIRDDRDLNNGGGPRLKQAITAYRNLRENREFRLMYSSAGRFFVREMELQRNFEEKGGITKKRRAARRIFSLSFAYMCLSGYGEKPKRLLIYAGILLAGGICLFYPAGQCSPVPWGCPTLIGLEAASRSLLDAMFGTNVTEPKQLLVRLPALFLTGMAFISLRRIYERRFRH